MATRKGSRSKEELVEKKKNGILVQTRRRQKAFTRDELVEVRIMLNGGRV